MSSVHIRRMNLKDWRLKQGKTQAQLAAELGAEQGLLSKWERGVVTPGGYWMAAIQRVTKQKVTAADFVSNEAKP